MSLRWCKRSFNRWALRDESGAKGGHCPLCRKLHDPGPPTAGAKTLTATYSGDSDFNGSAGTAPHQVNKADTTTTITSDAPDSSAVGQRYIVAWTVTVNSPGAGTPTGTVTVNDGEGNGCSAAVGVGSCSMASTLPGTKTLAASYPEDNDFQGSLDTEDHYVTGVVVPVHGEVHVIDPETSGICGTNPANGKGHAECKLWPDNNPSTAPDGFPEAGDVVVRLYDMKNVAFKTAYGSDPGPDKFKTIYGTNDLTKPNGGANILGLVGTCIPKKESPTPKQNGKLGGFGEALCGAPAATDILVLAGYKDYADLKGKPRQNVMDVNVVFGKKVETSSFQSTPTNTKLDGSLKTAMVPSGSGILWSQPRDIHAQKMFRKDGIIQYADAGKTVYLGSYLEIIFPTYTVWDEGMTRYVYPFILTGDSDWTLDVCAAVPQGYQIVGVYDLDGNKVQ